jgi:hypothetical protein
MSGITFAALLIFGLLNLISVVMEIFGAERSVAMS